MHGELGARAPVLRFGDMRSCECSRVVIRGVEPEIEYGRFPIKRIAGDEVVVRAAVFADGHDAISSLLQYRHESESTWQEVEMQALVNDQWRGVFTVEKLGQYLYTLTAWV